jgi:hypothetical protein
MVMGLGGFGDDAGIHEGEDAIEFGDACEFGGFGFAEGLGFVFFEEGFETGLEVLGEFKEVESSDLLNLDIGVDPGGGLDHCLGDHGWGLVMVVSVYFSALRLRSGWR